MGSEFPETLRGASHWGAGGKQNTNQQVPMSVKYRPLSENEMYSSFPIKGEEFQEGSFPHLRSYNVLFSHSFPFPSVLHSTWNLLSCANLKLLQWKTLKSSFPLLSTNNNQIFTPSIALRKQSNRPSPTALLIPFRPLMYTPVMHLTILTWVTVYSHTLV